MNTNDSNIVNTNRINEFYPISEAMQNCPQGLWQIQMTVKILDHLDAARRGDRDRESRLVNRLGQLRRNLEWTQISDGVKDAVEEAVRYLRTTGRTVNFTDPNPARWITTRDGNPRW